MSITPDPVPSTFDVPACPEGDLVLETLINARDRYRENGTDDVYWNGGRFCAIGSVAAAEYNGDREAMRAHEEKVPWYLMLERVLSESARTAIALLDVAADALYPEVFGTFKDHRGNHLGARIEDVNQFAEVEGGDPHFNYRAAVLNCYARAIDERQRCS